MQDILKIVLIIKNARNTVSGIKIIRIINQDYR